MSINYNLNRPGNIKPVPIPAGTALKLSGSVLKPSSGSDRFQIRFGNLNPQTLAHEFTQRWVDEKEIYPLFLSGKCPPEGLQLGDMPQEWGDSEKAFHFLNTFSQLLNNRDELQTKTMFALMDVDARQFDEKLDDKTVTHLKNDLILRDVLTRIYGDDLAGAPQNITYKGKINTEAGHNEIHRFDVGSRSFALKIYTGIGKPINSFRTWKFFEAQGARNSLRVYSCNAGTEPINLLNNRYEIKPWILSELVTSESLQEPNRGYRKLTDVAEQFRINLGNIQTEKGQVDAVHDVAVDGDQIADKYAQANSFEENLAAWKAQGF